MAVALGIEWVKEAPDRRRIIWRAYYMAAPDFVEGSILITDAVEPTTKHPLFVVACDLLGLQIAETLIERRWGRIADVMTEHAPHVAERRWWHWRRYQRRPGAAADIELYIADVVRGLANRQLERAVDVDLGG